MNFNTLMKSGEPTTGDPAESTESAEGAEETLVTEAKKPVNATALTLFAIIVIGIAGTYFMHLKTGPRSASAAMDTGPSANETVAAFLADGGRTINNMRVILQGTQKLVEQFKTYPSVAQVPLTDLKANPFHLSVSQAPAPQDSAEMARKKKEELKSAAMASAHSLRLQSLMSRGAKRMAMINNAMYQEGDIVDGFLIEKISAASVIVKQSPFRFELTMAK